MRRLALTLGVLALAGPAFGQAFTDPQPLSMPVPLGQASPLSGSGSAADVPLMPDPPLMGGAVSPGKPRDSQAAQRRAGDAPCPPSRPPGSLTSGGSGPGEYGGFVPSASTETDAARPAKPDRRAGMGRPLGGDRPLWGAPDGSVRNGTQDAPGDQAAPRTAGQTPRRPGDQDPAAAQEAAGRPDDAGCPARPPRDPTLFGR